MHVAVVVGPDLSSLENLPPCQTISTGQNVKQKHEGFCIVPDNNIKEKLIIGFNNLRSLNSWPIINEQLVIAIAAVFATAQKWVEIVFSLDSFYF